VFFDAVPSAAFEAAARCEQCPVADGCLLEAMRLDVAHRRGEDLWGVYGCYGGVWFMPGQMPTRVFGSTSPRQAA
jgi:hypothetical protein